MTKKQITNKSFLQKAAIVTVCGTAMIIPVAAMAWATQQSAATVCTDSGATITVSITNTEQNDAKAMHVVAKDEQTGNKIDLGDVNPDQTKTGTITTGKNSLGDGKVNFYLTWIGKDGSDTKGATYTAITCQGTTTTPTPTPQLSCTPTPSTESPTPTATPTPSCSPTPGVSETPTETPAPQITVIVESSNESSGGTGGGSTPTVQPAPQTTQLPETGGGR